MTLLHGWGRFPRADCELLEPVSDDECAQAVSARPVIARGLGRSYGDSSLATTVLSTRYLDRFQSFDPATGILQCDAGTTIAEILRVFAPRGWFPAVTPGTSFVTVGGAIASDVHGKNHHVDGTFTDHVVALEMLVGDGRRVTASATENVDLFHATCGGMGLTGMILHASLRLKPIGSSRIVQTTLKLANLDEALAAFEEHARSTYSVAWIDCTARGDSLGRSILFLGEHEPEGPLASKPRRRLAVPLDAPSWLTSSGVLRCFNAIYHARAGAAASTRCVDFEEYFYPLDSLLDWNRLYGSNGLLQYQFVLPEATAARGLREILRIVAEAGTGSFLAVLKKFGPGNANLLSFPTSGYTLALDFKATPAQLRALDVLDAIVLEHGGRIYLAKDARMSERVFKAGYPRWHEFEGVRARWHAHGHFASRQSRRLGLQ